MKRWNNERTLKQPKVKICIARLHLAVSSLQRSFVGDGNGCLKLELGSTMSSNPHESKEVTHCLQLRNSTHFWENKTVARVFNTRFEMVATAKQAPSSHYPWAEDSKCTEVNRCKDLSEHEYLACETFTSKEPGSFQEGRDKTCAKSSANLHCQW